MLLILIFSFDQTFGLNPKTLINNNPVVRLNHDSNDHSPVVRLDIDDDKSNELQDVDDERIFLQVKSINNQKRIVSKHVEVTTRVVYTFEDGSMKEVVEKNNHTFLN
jgi:hypothetical protein